MEIWADADACPGEVKGLLFRAARRTKTKVTLIANQANFSAKDRQAFANQLDRWLTAAKG